jgi:hypothetical protein
MLLLWKYNTENWLQSHEFVPAAICYSPVYSVCQPTNRSTYREDESNF